MIQVFEEGAKKGAEIAGAGTKIYTDFNEAINDPDVNAVVVTTPGQFHKGPVLAAIKAGKPVFSEKPLANTAADGKEIVEAEMAGGKHLVQVGFMRRYDRGYRQVKELIDSGKFGAPMVIKCTHRADGVADDYTTAMAVTDTAIHEIDVLPWLVNDEWDEVQCIMPKTNSKVKNALKDPQIMIMKTKGGIINMLEVNVNCGFGYDDKFPKAHIETKKMQYLYNDGELYYFMDNDTFDQIPLHHDQVEEALKYLRENDEATIKFYKGAPFLVEAPQFVDLVITDTEPGFAGNTAQGALKPATVETGLVIQVPLFIESGERVQIDTRTGEYLGRSKE